MHLRSKTLIGVLFAGVTVASIAFHATASSAQSAPPATSTQRCFADRATQNGDDATAQGTSVVHLSVEVASTTRLQLDGNGVLKAVGTNSGCAPKAGDDFIIEKNNTYTIASAELVAAALACKTSGDWDDTTTTHRCA